MKKYILISVVIPTYFLYGMTPKLKVEEDNLGRPLLFQIEGMGSIAHQYENDLLTSVIRYSENGELIYKHNYTYEKQQLIAENYPLNSGERHYTINQDEANIQLTDTWLLEHWQFDPAGNLIYRSYDDYFLEYEYDLNNQLVTYGKWNTLHHPLEAIIGDHGQILEWKNSQYSYDDQGRLIHQTSPKETKHYFYDDKGHLTQIVMDTEKVFFDYDAWGHRICKHHLKNGTLTTEHYLYYGNYEIGVWDDSGNCKELYIPGRQSLPGYIVPIALEKDSVLYIAIYDLQGNITKWVNAQQQTIESTTLSDPFGLYLKTSNNDVLSQRTYLAKRYHPEIGIVDFGSRDYHLDLMSWTTPDPIGHLQSANLYQYNMNNPFRYIDPDGNIAFVIPLVVAGGGSSLTVFLEYLGASVILFAGYEIVDKLNHEREKKEQEKHMSLNSMLSQEYELNGIKQYKGIYLSDPKEDWRRRMRIKYAQASTQSQSQIPYSTFQGYDTQEQLTQHNAQVVDQIFVEKRNSPPDPDPRAGGRPHTIIERPGALGQYTTHNGDNTFKQYRGAGKSHGDVDRPNVKENFNNPSPNGPKPGKPQVRKPEPHEIPKGN